MKITLLSLLPAIALALLTANVASAGVEEGRAKAEVCGACHGVDGNSATSDYPILAGQASRYIYLQLKDYKEGRRKHALMTPMVANLNKQDMRDLGDYFAAQKLKPVAFQADGAKVARGKKVADDALCPMCHLGGFAGQNEVPRVAGQHQAYVLRQLMAFKQKERTNDAGNMQSVMRNITVEDIEALSHYIADIR
jgi:cytochrome c553